MILRLLSYNIHKGVGGRDRRYRLARVTQVIEEQRPDFVCLQEVVRDARRARFDNQPQLLAEALGMPYWMFQLNVQYKRGGYGNQLLSRYPIRRQHQISLRLNTKKPRGAQMVIVETPQGGLHLVNFHLGLAEAERHWQLQHLIEHRLFREGLQLPTVMAGDVNDWRDTLHTAAVGHGLRQVTEPRLRFRSFPAWLPMGSLDKAFVCDKIEVKHARVVQNRLARVASDHLPLTVDFRIKQPVAETLDRTEGNRTEGNKHAEPGPPGTPRPT